ncbi:MAG: hypothetical protein ACE5K8_02580 [Candidatus Zixiibacteriota bacterium]
MKIIRSMNERVRRLNIFDVKLAQGAAMFIALILAKLVPDIMEISIWWFVALSALCAIKPAYVFLIRK